MWILHFLPDAVILWFCNILLLTGVVLTVAGFFAHRIPLVWQYQLPFKIAGVALLAVGVFFRGGYSVEMDWRERVAEVEAKLKVAEQQSAEANQKLDQKATTQTQAVKEKAVIVRQYIDREVVKYDNTCVVPKPFIEAHNRATETIKK